MSHLPDDQRFARGLRARQRWGKLWQRFFWLSTVVALLALLALFYNVVNQAFGYVVEQYEIDPATLAPDGNVGALENDGLVSLLLEYQPRKVAVYVRDTLSVVDPAVFTTLPLSQVLAGKTFPDDLSDKTIRDLSPEQQGSLLSVNLTHEQLVQLVNTEVVGAEILQSWDLTTSLFERGSLEAIAREQYPNAKFYFRSWVNFNFLLNPGSSTPGEAGVRTALLGSVWVIAITVLFAFPIGVGAAIYLEEYASRSRLNQIIETNVRNLAGVPSIIYGLLGLAIFVRALEFVTEGRTLLSAGLTMGLLILPVIIINAQEALRAVPSSIREASLGLGATKWQTIWNQVLPAAMPGIMTGTILAMSRAIGETAPLIVIGASTFILFDPNGPLSKFTALPIQIYQWTSRPQDQFRDIAAAAIIVLLTLLLLLNASAIILRQRFKRNLQG
ncbi:MAG: phosphate ABC transporter permease PstA [Chloroflexota bacterium]